MPSRSSRFTRSLVTGYGGIAVNILFSLASIPLALHYLPGEEFGLWALALQVNGYLALIDFGMSGAVGRFLADHKDDVNGTAYREHFATGLLVFAVQGTLVAILGTVLSLFAPSLLSIPSHLAADFTSLLASLCFISAVSIFGRTLSGPLWAFQRMDVVNLGGALGLVFQFIVMWLGFHLGFGVRSFVPACAATVLVSIVLHAWTNLRNGYLPARHGWFRPRWKVFKDMFAFGRDGMLLSIGSQLVNATQITIVSRVLGLDAAASYSIATKLYGMCLMLFHKVIESAAPGLAEMHVRGETKAFVHRYWDAIRLTLATATIGAVGLAAGNSAFITLWTGGKIAWPIAGDALLGLLILVSSMSRAFMAVFGITKDLKQVRLLYFLEGLVFVPTAIISARCFGVVGVLAASLVVHSFVTLLASARTATRVLGSVKHLVAPLLIALSLLAGAVAAAGFSRHSGLPASLCLVVAIVAALVTMPFSWFLMIPRGLQTAALARVRPLLARFRVS